MDSIASLASLPVELHLEIQSYLSHIDIERLSQCSRTLRSLFLPQVFHSVKISQESLRLFNDADILRQLYSCVRHITLPEPSPRLNQIINLRVLLDSIALFSRITSLKLTYNASDMDQNAVFTAILSKINSYQFLPSLKAISLTVSRSQESLSTDPDLTIEDHEFLNLEERQGYSKGLDYRINTINIPNLQTAKIKLLHSYSLFCFDESPIFERIFSNINIFSLSRALSASLKILHLQTYDLIYPDTSIPGQEYAYLNHPQYTTYPIVTELHITIQWLEIHQLQDISRRFQNLQILIVKEKRPGLPWDYDGTRPFKEVIRMKKLKTVCLPWVLLWKRLAAKWKLESSVMYWFCHGLADLEDICFEESQFIGVDGDPEVVASAYWKKSEMGAFKELSVVS